MRPGKRGKSLRMKMYWMTRLKAWTLRRNAELTCGDACHMSLKVVCTTLTTQRGSTGKNNFQFPDPAWKWHSNKHFSGSWWEFDQCVVWVGVSVEMGPLAVRCLTHGSPPLHSLSLRCTGPGHLKAASHYCPVTRQYVCTVCRQI